MRERKRRKKDVHPVPVRQNPVREKEKKHEEGDSMSETTQDRAHEKNCMKDSPHGTDTVRHVPQEKNPTIDSSL